MLLPIFASKALSEAGFRHGFTTRLGGVSPPPYASLDFAVRREPELLRENQARVARAVGFEPEVIHQAIQVHGTSLITAAGDPRATLGLEADALVAEPGSGHAVAVRVADCVPVLIADPASGRVAAVHAGWRGVEAGMVRAAVRHLAESSSAGPSSGFLVAIGPCIGPCCFEVGSDVGDRLVAATNEGVVDRRVGDKVFVDLRRAVRTQLTSLGLLDASIDDVPSRGREGCTHCDAVRYYSYRRDGDASGRLLAVIVARDRLATT